MSEAPRTLRAGYRVGLLALSIAAVLALSACAAPLGKTSTAHTCADKVAKASVAGAVPGLWACLDTGFQTNLHAIGEDGDKALIKTPFALSAKALGCTADVCVYELTLLPDIARQAGVKTAVLAVWIDRDGLVSNVGIPSPIY